MIPPKRQSGYKPTQTAVYPGDLCQYMSRTVLVLEKKDIDWVICQELGSNDIRKIRETALTIIQPA